MTTSAIRRDDPVDTVRKGCVDAGAKATLLPLPAEILNQREIIMKDPKGEESWILWAKGSTGPSYLSNVPTRSRANRRKRTKEKDGEHSHYRGWGWWGVSLFRHTVTLTEPCHSENQPTWKLAWWQHRVSRRRQSDGNASLTWASRDVLSAYVTGFTEEYVRGGKLLSTQAIERECRMKRGKADNIHEFILIRFYIRPITPMTYSSLSLLFRLLSST